MRTKDEATQRRERIESMKQLLAQTMETMGEGGESAGNGKVPEWAGEIGRLTMEHRALLRSEQRGHDEEVALTCATCLHWDPDMRTRDTPEALWPQSGACQRKPPVNLRADQLPVWPRTGREDWCGKHQLLLGSW